MHHAGRTGPVAGRLPVLAFEAVSEFGYSIARPTAALIALWACGAAVFARQTALGGWEAAGFSFANMFKFFGLQRTYFDFGMIRDWPGWVQWVSGGQTVLAFVLLFFLGLGLRTRFRLR